MGSALECRPYCVLRKENHVSESEIEVEEWCLLYKRLTRMSIGELTGESVRKDIMARYDHFRSIE